MEIKEFLETQPHELARKQHDALKQYVISRIKDFIKILNDEHYETAKEQLAFSPAGDDHGCDNSYLDFNETGMEDIGDVLNKLMELKEQAKGK